MPRDLVRTESTERLDKPDLDALQRNGRSDTRTSLAAFLFGNATTDRVLGGWQMTANGPPDARVNIAAGRMVANEQLDDGSFERGVVYGLESTVSVALDFTGAPVAVYNVYIRFVQTPGAAGTRVFWDQDAVAEAVASIDTREVAAWAATRNTISPGTDWIKIGEVDWDGAAVVAGDITHDRFMFFEGDENAAFAQIWGGGTDRSADRGQFGVTNLYQWVHFVRRQIADILGQPEWWAVPARDLADLDLHLGDSTDPHGALLTQTNLDVSTLLRVLGTLQADTIDSVAGAGITFADDVDLGAFDLSATEGFFLNEVNATKFAPTTNSGVLPAGDEDRLFQNSLVACAATVTGLAGVPILNAGHHNVATFTRIIAGSYTLAFDQALPAGYTPMVQVLDGDTVNPWLVSIDPAGMGVGGFGIITAQNVGAGFVQDDPPQLSVIVIHG